MKDARLIATGYIPLIFRSGIEIKTLSAAIFVWGFKGKELIPIDKGGKMENGRAASTESVPIHLTVKIKKIGTP